MIILLSLTTCVFSMYFVAGADQPEQDHNLRILNDAACKANVKINESETNLLYKVGYQPIQSDLGLA